MELTKQIAKQFREVYLSGKLVAFTNLKEALSTVTWEQANTKIGDLNTIAMLAFHINYYVAGLIKVLEGGPLDIRDKYSFDMAPIESQKDWEMLLTQIETDGERFAQLVEQMPDSKLKETFVDPKYGNYYQNLTIIIDHCYYHFGQIVLLKKLITNQ